ncbi:MAG: glycerophosphodiester phosphodiesterase [Acidobacteriota bacterium]|jgi:glycerophosphoryl diester phosphodiesterase
MIGSRPGSSANPWGRPLIIGHRGFPARFPDNSLAGIQAALDAGADGVEVDVRPSVEGVWVCHHDRSRGGRPVSSWPLADLRSAAVPTLAAVVDLLPPAAWLYVEVKPLPFASLTRLVDPLLRLLEPRSATTRILSSSRTILGFFQCLAPRLPRSWVVNEVPAHPVTGLELSPHHPLVERLLGHGVPLHPWTVNRRARMVELARMGVASITTNHPDRAVEALRG